MVWKAGRTFLSGAATSGRMLWKGRTSSRNLTARGPSAACLEGIGRTHSRPF